LFVYEYAIILAREPVPMSYSWKWFVNAKTLWIFLNAAVDCHTMICEKGKLNMSRGLSLG
jgi:hypothetical protein